MNSVVLESNLEELISIYDINDHSSYGNAISQPDALFSHIIVDSIHQYFIIINDVILSVNPDLMPPPPTRGH
jgi:hypothetical protein